IAEEKQVTKITAKVKEARKSKSFDTFYCVACFVSEETLSRIIVPLKNVLFECNNHKVLKKVSRCIQKVVFGLTENSSLSESCLLTFFYGIVHGLIPELTVSKERKSSSVKTIKSDYMLVEKPSKKEKKVKSKISTNRFILVQECLHILHILLKKDRLKSTNAEHVALLEPFVSLLSDFIVSNHPRLSTMALKCLNLIILRFSTLESFKTYANTIKNNLFVLMHKHTGVGMQQGENYDLVIMLFKTMHCLISEIDFVQLDEKQLEVLLVYCEKDIYENSRQAVAFAMLKAIISRRLQSPALKDIMSKLAGMLVQSHQDYVRKQCIHIWMRYLTDIPLGLKLRHHLMFFIRQLDYEHETGRLAVLELLMSVVARFPDVFNSYIDLLFIPVASRLINEESKKAKELASEVITKIFHRADFSKRNSLVSDIILSWFQHSSVLQKQLAVRLLILLSDVEQQQFKKRFHLIIPLLKKNLEACIEVEDNNAEFSTPEDHLVYQLLILFLRMLKIEGNLSKSEEFLEDIFAILKSINETYLSHAHLWVRIVSVEIFEELFASFSVEEVSCAMNEPKVSNEYLLSNTPLVMWSLCSKFLDLLRNVSESDVFGGSLIKNMLFVAKVFIRTPDSWESNEELCYTKMNIKWLISRMVREVRREVSENEKCYTKRTLIFKWIAATVLELNSEQLSSSLEVLLMPLCREVSSKRNENEKVDSSLINLVEDVLKVIRGAVGKDTFNNKYAKIISIQNRRRMHRKSQRTIELIVNPLKGLKRKHKKHVAFRENKKRKIAEKKGKVVKKRRVS
ncbi:small subunit processome component 20-like protein, partial [Leptotrombidium deliense]